MQGYGWTSTGVDPNLSDLPVTLTHKDLKCRSSHSVVMHSPGEEIVLLFH